MSNTRGPSVNKIKGMIDFRKSFEYVRELKLVVNTEFIKAKEKLIQNFEQHPVTREIEAGVNVPEVAVQGAELVVPK